MTVVQVRQFSWHYSDKHGLYNMKHRFERSNKQINSVILSPLSQAPLVPKVRLLRVTRKIGQQERPRGERFSVSMFKSLSKGERNVTSSSIPAKNQRDNNMLYFGKCNAGMGINSPKHSYMDNIHIISNCEGQEKGKERENPSMGRLGNDDIIASSTSDVTPPATVSVEKTSKLVARKRFLTTEYSVLSFIDNVRKRWMAFRGLISLLVIRFITMFSLLGEITGISRYERKSLIGNSMECVYSERLGNVRTLSPFCIFLECLNTILRFQRKLWNYDIIYLVWGRNRIGTRGRRRLWSFISRPIFELRNLRLGNTFQETFMLRSGNVLETFMDKKRFEIYLCLFSDLRASCLGQLRLFKRNLKFRNRFKAIYGNIYLYIYVFCRDLLSCKLASYPGTFAVKMYTLVYFSPKVTLLVRKRCHKNQSINLIGLAHVGKAYSRKWLFLEHNRPYWRELRHLVTPWVRCIKEGTDPLKGQKRALLSHVQVSFLPLSLSSPSLVLFCSSVLNCNY